jgi:hypothetical protein
LWKDKEWALSRLNWLKWLEGVRRSDFLGFLKLVGVFEYTWNLFEFFYKEDERISVIFWAFFN